MKLYSKQLNSLEELRREKHVLQYAKKHTDEWLSFSDLDKNKEHAEDAAGAGILGTLLSAAGSKSLFSTVLALAPPILTLLSKNTATGKKKSNPLEKLAKEVAIGYIKWKAIQMAYRGLKMLMKSDKKDKEKEHP